MTEDSIAKVWLVKEGGEPTLGEPSPVPLAECITKLGLTKDHWHGDLGTTPRFGEADRLQAFRGYKHVIVEIDEVVAKTNGWKPGFYLAPVTPIEARKQLPNELRG